ncbi:MAG: arylsulfatase [Limisphaera sp.]|nr:arylsulfatase [Limisphaera sp.]
MLRWYLLLAGALGWTWMARVSGSAGPAEPVAQAAPSGATNPQPPVRPAVPRRPNILLIVADDLGYGDLGCYGSPHIQTPHLDRLAAEGIRFTQFYAGSTVCAPARAALMLGRHTGHLRIRGNRRGVSLTADELTMSEFLRAMGYRTGLIGKWGLAVENSPGVPWRKGFDEFVGYLDNHHAHDYYTTYLWRYDPYSGYEGRLTLVENFGNARRTYIPDLCTRAATNFIRIHKPEWFNGYRPFLLMLCYTIPHANNEEGRRTGNGMQVPSDAPYSTRPWPQPEKNKAAMITRMDADIGRIMELLKVIGQEDNTLVIFTSDNGPHGEGGVDPAFLNSAGALRGMKRDLYEGGIRVPMIVRWPLRVRPGQVSDFVWTHWDIFPTLAEAVGTNAPAGLDGISVFPLWTGGEQTNRHEYLYWEFHERGFQQALRWGDWKAVRTAPGQPLELYNLRVDPGEKHNVAEEHPEVIAKIEEFLKRARVDSPEWPVQASTPAAALESRAQPDRPPPDG